MPLVEKAESEEACSVQQFCLTSFDFQLSFQILLLPGEWVTCAIQLRISPEDMGLKPEYVVFSVEPDCSKELGAPVKRRLIRRISTEYPSPVHTIGLTEKYIVMIQIPYPLNWDGMLNAEAKWLMNGVYEGNLNDYNTWEPERGTTIRIINRETGEETGVFQTDPYAMGLGMEFLVMFHSYPIVTLG
eukprot:s100_g22.t1